MTHRSNVPKNELRRQTVQGLASTAVTTILMIALQILNVAILSRMLTPANFGAVAAPIALASGFSLFVEFGLGANVIQRKDADATLIGTAFSAVICFGLIATMLMLVLVGPIAHILSISDNRLLYTSSFLLILIPIANFFECLLLKKLLFHKAMAGNLVGSLVGQLLVPVGLALLGFGPFALIWGQLALPFSKIICYFALGYSFPTPRFHFSVLRNMMRFSFYFTLTKFFSFVALQGDRVVLTALTSETMVGLYTRAQHFSQILITLITSALEKVVFPVLAHLQGQRERTTAVYQETMSAVALLSGMAAFGAAVCADELVWVLLGDSWAGVVPLARIFSIMIVLRALDKTAAMLMRNDRMVRERAILQGCFAIVTVGSAWIFGRFDLQLVAGAIVLGSALGFLYTIYVTSQYLGITRLDALSPLRGPTLALAIAALVTWLAEMILGQWLDSAAIRNISALLLAYGVVLATGLAWPNLILGKITAAALKQRIRSRKSAVFPKDRGTTQ